MALVWDSQKCVKTGASLVKDSPESEETKRQDLSHAHARMRRVRTVMMCVGWTWQ